MFTVICEGRKIDSKYYNTSRVVTEVDLVDESGWYNILDGFSDTSLYSTWGYGAVRWGEKNLSHLVQKKDGTPFAAAQVRIIRSPLLPMGIAYVRSGPLFRLKNRQYTAEAFRSILDALFREYVHKRKMILRIAPNIMKLPSDPDFASEIAAMLYQKGYSPGCDKDRHMTMMLDLSLPLDKIRQNLHQKWRGHLNKAERIGFSLSMGTGDDLYNDFRSIYREMQARKKFVEYVDIDQFGEIQKRLPDSYRMNIAVASLSDRPVSAIVWSQLGNVGIAIFSATVSNALKQCGSYLLRWKMIEEMQNSGLAYLDQGGVDRWKNPGSYNFKKGMSGFETEYIGMFDAYPGPAGRLFMGGIDSFRALVRGSREMYQHFTGSRRSAV